MDHLIGPLKNLGLSEKEAAVYLALLQLGSATPYQIAKKSGLKRPTAYIIAESLVEKGLIVHIPGEEKKRYIAKQPDDFFEEQEERLAAAKKILPELRSYQKNTAEKPSILYFEGLDGMRQAYQYGQKELDQKEIVGFFASNADASSGVTDFFLHWNDNRQKHGTTVRGLTVDSPDLTPYGRFVGREKGRMALKFLPPEMYNAHVSIESCAERFVRIFLFESVETLIIESPKLASAVKDIFELLWKNLEGRYDRPGSWK